MGETEYSVIGKPVPRIDAPAKAKGEAIYTTDITLPGMLYGKLLRSPHPHAKIVSIDTSEAEKLAGVKAVVTAKDAPDIQYGIMMKIAPGSGDQHLPARDKVRYIGDAVAAVAAIDEDVATEALSRIAVVYEALPAYFTVEEATKPDAVLIHAAYPGNISTRVVSDFGDVEKGFQDADYVRTDVFKTQSVQHCALETHATVAQYDPTGKLTLWVSTQAAYLMKGLMAEVLGIPEGMVRVIKPHVGGGFGGKMEVFPMDLCCALLSKKSGRPVKIYLTREEEFAASRTRHPAILELKIGVKKDGQITGKAAKVTLDGGAYASYGYMNAFLTTLHLSIPYKQPHIKFEVNRVYTNKPVAGAMRGFCSPQAHFAAELQLDMVAEALGMDPLDIRIKNGLKAGDVTPNGLKMTSGALADCIEQVKKKAQWKNKYKQLPPLRGIGIGCNSFICGSRIALNPATALANILIKADTSGTVTILSGAADIGQGCDTTFCQIAAEELGLPMEDVNISVVDTDISPPDSFSASSRVTFMVGNATLAAANDLKEKLFKAVADKLEANVDDLVAKDRKIFIKDAPETGVTFSEAISICQLAQNGATITGKGSFNPDLGPFDPTEGAGNYSPAYTFGAVVAEVAVDPHTGRVKIDKLTRAHDCGQIINLLGVEGQLDGATSMAVAYALSEELLQENGRPLNPTFLDYKMPTVMEMPEMENIHVESCDPGGPFGAKEVGEGIVSPIAPAILNAVYDATGIRFKEIPLTPEKVLSALREKGGK
ncbi:MAG: molybdopterin-dependent oxidoreductase [Deltaproteobacteria bacterium]|nr:molybdopterin-dependent oxidoreductase [Deltaproteobacteria bacterium]